MQDALLEHADHPQGAGGSGAGTVHWSWMSMPPARLLDLHTVLNTREELCLAMMRVPEGLMARACSSLSGPCSRGASLKAATWPCMRAWRSAARRRSSGSTCEQQRSGEGSGARGRGPSQGRDARVLRACAHAAKGPLRLMPAECV